MLRKSRFFAVVAVLLAALLWPTLQGEHPLRLGLDLSGGARVVYRPDLETVPDRYAEFSEDELLALTKEALSGRLLYRFDTLPDVVVRSDGRIVVSLPGEHDQRRVLETVGKTYRLTFRRALATHPIPPEGAQGLVRPHEGRWLELGEELLTGDMLAPSSIRVEGASEGMFESPGQGTSVSFQFRPPFDERFAQITRESIGETLAILLDDRVEWAGRVEEEIRGRGSLRGGYTLEEAAEVASLLRSGDLPVSLGVEQLSAVGPTLGQEMKDRGQMALLGSAGLLALLLVLAYGHRPALLVTGLVSLASLLFFTVGLIGALGLTVDLVAIAGLVLSIGMGMDAFILVFEALESDRHERRLSGKSPLSRLRSVYGFRGQGRTLLHANATTLLVLVVLLASERLESFALFLVVGIAASLLTVLVTRWCLTTFARRGWLEDVDPPARRSPLGLLRSAAPQIFRARRAYLWLIGLFLVASAAFLAIDESARWITPGADFQPGLELRMAVPDGSSIEPMMDQLRARYPTLETRHQLWQDSSLSPGETGFLVTLEGPQWDGATGLRGGSADAPPPTGALSPGALSALVEDHGGEIRGLYSVDARLSGRRILGSISALGFSFGLLALYLAFFQPRIDRYLSGSTGRKPTFWGARLIYGTVCAVILDVIVVLTALALLEIPIGLPVIAALLTIIGYSVNDSMVLASHLSRADRTEPKERNRLAWITRGVDAMLSRTVLTSVSTVIPAVTILVAGLTPLSGFAWAVLIGTAAGTLSSIFIVASSILGAKEASG